MAKKKTNTAVEKIDMANCYRMLIDMEFFDEKDGPEHILNQVEEEVRQFATYRLEMLLGERDNKGPIQIEGAQLPFSAKEVEILKLLAKSAAKGLNEEDSSDEEINNQELKQVLSEDTTEEPARVPRRRRKRGTSQVSRSNSSNQEQDQSFQTVDQVLEAQKNPEKYQRIPKKHKPVPMPTQAEIDGMHAAQAHEYAGSFDNMFQGSINRLLKE